MVALGTYLLVSVAAVSPPAHGGEKLASTFDEAYCDVDDSGECADEPAQSAPVAAAVLDCESPYIQEMIGSCDLPKQAPPTVRVPTLHAAAGIASEVRTDPGGVHVINAPPSVDTALPPLAAALRPADRCTSLLQRHQTATLDVPRPRLDRPPRV